MIAAWKWGKWFGLVALLALLAITGFALKASEAEQSLLEAQLKQAKQDNQANLVTINALQHDNQQITQLLIERRQRQLTERQELENEIQQLKAKMAGIECVIPSDVTERLRKPY